MDEIKKQIESIDDNAMFTPKQITELGVVINTKLVPSVFTFYRLIKRGQLKPTNLGSGGSPRYFVKGKDLKEFLGARYQIEIV
jgi:hypothetical protein